MYIKVKSEKGFTGVDITVALIIILLLMSLISVLFFNITKTSKDIDRRSEAVYLATEIIEGVKSKEYDDIKITGTGTDNDWVEVKNGKNQDNNEDYIYYEKNGESITIAEKTKIDDGYGGYISIYNHIPQNNDNNENNLNSDLVKVIKVEVRYKVGGEIKKVELSSSIVRKD